MMPLRSGLDCIRDPSSFAIPGKEVEVSEVQWQKAGRTAQICVSSPIATLASSALPADFATALLFSSALASGSHSLAKNARLAHCMCFLYTSRSHARPPPASMAAATSAPRLPDTASKAPIKFSGRRAFIFSGPPARTALPRASSSCDAHSKISRSSGTAYMSASCIMMEGATTVQAFPIFSRKNPNNGNAWIQTVRYRNPKSDSIDTVIALSVDFFGRLFPPLETCFATILSVTVCWMICRRPSATPRTTPSFSDAMSGTST
mmetsp:Transcript_1039/g.6574  ORF Transcript_1039/g.6574 Transcript_1039/m.6574 type:complete len:263 (+) Transcript_1039:2159-2947(+)